MSAQRGNGTRSWTARTPPCSPSAQVRYRHVADYSDVSSCRDFGGPNSRLSSDHRTSLTAAELGDVVFDREQPVCRSSTSDRDRDPSVEEPARPAARAQTA